MTQREALEELLNILIDDLSLEDLTLRRLEDLAQDIFDSDD